MVHSKLDHLILKKIGLSGKKSHKAVAPVIATLLMVAIAVVGGTVIFVFSQSFFSDAQISGSPLIESIKILGYDFRDVDALRVHDGTMMAAGTGGNQSAAGKLADERVAIFIQNHGVDPVTLQEIRLGGTVYLYDVSPTLSLWNSTTSLSQGQYSVLMDSSSLLQDVSPTLPAGQTATIIVDLDDNYVLGRDTQFKITTNRNNVFVGTLLVGQNSG